MTRHPAPLALARRIAAWALALLLTPAWAAASQLEDVRQRGELACGTLGTDEPNSYVDPATRTIIGYDVDLCSVVAKALGVRPVIRQVSVAARIPELQQGHIDLLSASLSHTREREVAIDFSLTVLVTGQRVLVRKDSGITSLAQLGGRRITAVRGGTLEANVLKAVPTARVITFDTSPQALVALQQGKADGFANDEVSLARAWAELGPARTDFLLLPGSISTEYFALGVRKGEPSFRQAVNQALRALEASGEAERLFMKWYGPGSRVGFSTRTFRIDSDRLP